MRWWWLLVVGLAACASQPVSPAAVEPADQAWMAWRAAEQHDLEHAPELVKALRASLAQPASSEGTALVRQQLDALLVLGAEVDADLLAELAQRPAFAVQVLLLSARAPQVHAATLLDLRPQLDGLERLAVDGLLAEGAPRDLAHLLVREARLPVTVHAVDENHGAGGGGWSTTLGCGSITAPPGWPPLVRYEIVRLPHTGATPLCAAPHPLGWVRHVQAGTLLDTSTRWRSTDVDEHAWQQLAYLAQQPPQPLLQGRMLHVAVAWRNATQFRQELEQLTAERQVYWTQLLSALVERHLLEPSALTLPLPLDYTFVDARADQSLPLR